jgi:hypothetical protein
MKDYIIIYIKEMSSEEIKKSMDIAIAKIKKETSFFTFFINLNYYFIFSYFNFLFKSTFIASSLIINFDKTNYLVKKPVQIVVLDNGIKIHNNFVPYENVVIFKYLAGIVNIEILGSVNKDLKFELDSSGNKINISVNCINGMNLVKLIKKNMYYHIRYNKINTEVINYYKNT